MNKKNGDLNLSAKVKTLNFFRGIFKIPFLEEWLAKKTFGRSIHAFYSKLVPNNYQYTPGSKRNITRLGLHYTVDLYDYIGHYIFFGFFSREMQCLFSLVKEGDVVIDIGANYGFVTLNLAQRVGSTGKIYSFEPDPQNYKACILNLSKNDFNTITLVNKGLGASSGQMTLEVPVVWNRGGNRINPNPIGEYSIVDIIMLDDYVTKENIQRIDLIKIDVEGFEFQILKGAQKVLANFHPILFIEVDDENLHDQGDSPAGMLKFLMDLGYDSFQRADTNDNIDLTSNFKNVHYDIICKKIVR